MRNESAARTAPCRGAFADSRAMSDFVEHLRDVFRPLGVIDARRMFGGYGIYHDGLMFAIVMDDVLYLKADKKSAAFFERGGLPKFSYQRNGRTATLSFYCAPETIMEDSGEALSWAHRALEAALRARAAKRMPKNPTRATARRSSL